MLHDTGAVLEIIDRYPLLHYWGYGPDGDRIDVVAEHEALASASSVARIITASQWACTSLKPRKTINPWPGSYGLKHLYERDTGCDISNGQIIVAMMLAGFTARLKHYNAVFAVSEPSYRRLRERTS